MRQFLIDQLRNLSVKDELKLIHYVDFCLSNSIQEKIIFETSLHHILPKAKNLPFICFSNLKVHEWNGVNLYHHDHYIAHYLLFESIDHYSITKSFVAMHEKDYKLGRISEEVLVNADNYDIAMKSHKKLMSIHMNTILENGLTRAQEAAKKQIETKRLSGYYETSKVSQLYTVEATEKRMKTLMTINDETGLTRAQEIGKKVSETRMNLPMVECPHCNTVGKSGTNMTRYHFDNCPINKGLMDKETYIKNKKSGNLHSGIPEKSPRKQFKQRRGCCLNCYGEFGLSNLKNYHGSNCKKENHENQTNRKRRSF